MKIISKGYTIHITAEELHLIEKALRCYWQSTDNGELEEKLESLIDDFAYAENIYESTREL